MNRFAATCVTKNDTKYAYVKNNDNRKVQKI